MALDAGRLGESRSIRALVGGIAAVVAGFHLAGAVRLLVQGETTMGSLSFGTSPRVAYSVGSKSYEVAPTVLTILDRKPRFATVIYLPGDPSVADVRSALPLVLSGGWCLAGIAVAGSAIRRAQRPSDDSLPEPPRPPYR